MFDPFFVVDAFLCAGCLGGAIAAITYVAAFSAVAVTEGFGGEGGD